MKLTSKLAVLLIITASFISVADLIIRPGHPVTFDGHIHMTTMNQFSQAIKSSEFPVTWSNNFANYGLPLPLFAHQVPNYLGSFLILLGFSTETAYILLLTSGITISSILFYYFFKLYSNETIAFTATIIAIFFPYRALNIYTRGALPEIISTVFLPVLFFGIWNIQQKKYFIALILLILGTLGVALTHPMMLVVFGVPLSIYFFANIDRKHWLLQLSLVVASTLLGVLTASYYLLPLLLEMKYFYQAAIKISVGSESYLSLKQLYDPTWYYTLTHPGPRANYIKLGFFEFFIFITAITTLLLSKVKSFKKKILKKEIKNLFIWTLMSTITILLMLPLASFFYSLPIVSQIQYPWRFLNVLQFLIPGLFVMIVISIPKLQNKFFLLTVIVLVLWFRIPEFYGKNYIVQPESDYEFNQANLHSINMNTIWSGNSEKYPIKNTQTEIIEGDGSLDLIESKNASRKYRIDAKSDVRVLDSTFYFPGWELTVNQEPMDIQYQDLLYRGLITYRLPPGQYFIELEYKATRTRQLGYLLTTLGAFSSMIFLVTVRNKKFK